MCVPFSTNKNYKYIYIRNVPLIVIMRLYECASDSRINNKKYKLSTTEKNEKNCVSYILWLNGFIIAIQFEACTYEAICETIPFRYQL